MAAPRMENFDCKPNVLKIAARNWRLRGEYRENNKIKVAIGRLREVETDDRIRNKARFREKAHEAAHEPMAEARVVRPPMVDIFQERLIGDRDFLGIEFLEMAAAVARFVGRVNIRSGSGKILGYGTGFVVSPRLLITNNHVLPSAETARYSQVEFDYQKNRFGKPLPVVACALEPETFFLTDRRLDFTLVALSARSVNGILLSDYAWVRLYPETGKVLIGDPVNIIQHPRGEMKQLVLRSNKLVDRLDDLLHYETDTEPGSSGAPVFSDDWFAVALHHSGVPKTNDDGDFLDVDGQLWREGRDDPNRLAWAGNEGIRVSSIIRAVEKANLGSSAQRDLRRDFLELDPPHPLELVKSLQSSPTPERDGQASGGTVSFLIPVKVTVSLGTPEIPSTAMQVMPSVVSPSGAVSLSETPVVQNARSALKRGDGDSKPARYDAVLTAARAEFGSIPGVLGVELGYVFKNGWITDTRAIVVTIVRRDKNGNGVRPTVPDRFQGVSVQTTGPGIEDLLALRSGRAVAEAIFAEAVVAEEIVYQPPTSVELEKITDTMRVVAHLGPDNGWAKLKEFLADAKTSLTIGMYDFGARHILEAILAHRATPSFRKLTLTIQKGESLGGAAKANDLPDEKVIQELAVGFKDKFDQAWVKIGSVNGWVASSYHIKVAVRDGKAFWLSSGNWQSSNQPKDDPFVKPKTKGLLKKYNREWHAIIEHKGLAKTFEAFLLHDYENNKGTDGLEDFMLPDVLVPDEFFAHEAAEDPNAWEYFQPFDQERKFTVTPLLTPDNYHAEVLNLIRSAQSELLIQNQTFNAPKENHDSLRELVEAVLEKQRAGLKVRVIFRLLDYGSVRKNLSALKDLGFDIDGFRVQKNCHTKGIIVDGKRVLLGSQNWSNHGVSINRDASLLFDDEELAAYFKRVFEHDWVALADKDIGSDDGGLELTNAEETPPGMVRLSWKDYVEGG